MNRLQIHVLTFNSALFKLACKLEGGNRTEIKIKTIKNCREQLCVIKRR